MKVFDVIGRELETLVNEKQPVGTYEATFNGSQLSSGVYFYKLVAGDPDGSGQAFSETKRMVLVK